MNLTSLYKLETQHNKVYPEELYRVIRDRLKDNCQLCAGRSIMSKSRATVILGNFKSKEEGIWQMDKPKQKQILSTMHQKGLIRVKAGKIIEVY